MIYIIVSAAVIALAALQSIESLPLVAPYDAVFNDIMTILTNDSPIGGSALAPKFLRLAWHASGTYDKVLNVHGSLPGTFHYEMNYSINAGLPSAVDLLNPIIQNYPSVSCGDVYTLAGVVAVKYMGGPDIAWRPGRLCSNDKSKAAPADNLLPQARIGADAGPAHVDTMNQIRTIFTRLGFSDQETVALIGAHGMGKMSLQNSGYSGRWTDQDTSFGNAFYIQLLSGDWQPLEPTPGVNDKLQYLADYFVMMPSDLGFRYDSSYNVYVQKYASQPEAFSADFATAFGKLLDLGVNTFPGKNDNPGDDEKKSSAIHSLSIMKSFNFLIIGIISAIMTVLLY